MDQRAKTRRREIVSIYSNLAVASKILDHDPHSKKYISEKKKEIHFILWPSTLIHTHKYPSLWLKQRFHEKVTPLPCEIYPTAFSSVLSYSFPLYNITFYFFKCWSQPTKMISWLTMWQHYSGRNPSLPYLSPAPLPGRKPSSSHGLRPRTHSWAVIQGAGTLQRKRQERNSFWPRVEKYLRGSRYLTSPSSLEWMLLCPVNHFP